MSTDFFEIKVSGQMRPLTFATIEHTSSSDRGKVIFVTKVVFKSIKGAQTVTMWRAFTLDGEDLTMTERAVSNFLALHYSSKRGYAYPSRDLIADSLGITLRSVTRAIHGLRDKGIWGVCIGRGGIYKGKGSSVSSLYYPSAAIIRRHILSIKDEKMQDRLSKGLIYFDAVVDSLNDDEPQATLPSGIEEAEAPTEDDLLRLTETVGMEDSAESTQVLISELPVDLLSKYAGMPTALAGALTLEEANEFMATSSPEKIEEAFNHAASIAKAKGASVVAVTVRKALKVAKIPPAQFKDGWAGWLMSFGLKHVPNRVHPLYNEASDLGEFRSLLDELSRGHEYHGTL